MPKIISLENGLTLAMEKIDHVRSISFGIWVANGSRFETPKENGISHFIEHMLFKGSEKYTAKEIADIFDSMGGQLNAYTTKEYTCYHFRVLDTHFDQGLEVICDMFFHSLFSDEEIDKERNVILEEIDMYEDSAEELVHDLHSEGVWGKHPLSYPILGTKQTVKQFKHEDFVNYVKTHYLPSLTVVSVAGNFDLTDMEQKLRKCFSQFSSSEEHRNEILDAQYKKSIILQTKDTEQLHLCMGFPSLPIDSDKNYALAILNSIFGGGMSSRLFQSIREENGLTYSIYSYYQAFLDAGLFSIYAAYNENQNQEVIRLILNEIKNLQKQPIDKETLAKHKELLKSNYLIGLESTSTRMSSLGRNLLRLNRYVSPDDLIAKIDAVSTQDLNELIRQIFNIDELSLTVVGKVDHVDFQKIIQKYK